LLNRAALVATLLLSAAAPPVATRGRCPQVAGEDEAAELLRCLRGLVARMARGSVGVDGAVAWLGGSPRRDSPDEVRVGTPWRGVATAEVERLPHAGIDLAVELVLDEGARPRLADVEAEFGRSRAVPRRPDSVDPDRTVAIYVAPPKSTYRVRILAEVAPEDAGGVKSLTIDRERMAAR
jgi:hypothetical protein